MSAEPAGDDCVVVMCTAPAAAAPEIARRVVEERLCACVNIVPSVRSFFRWEGEVEEAEESLLVAKTAASTFDALRDRLHALHPYDVPEVIALDVSAGSPAYLAWLLDSVGARGRM